MPTFSSDLQYVAPDGTVYLRVRAIGGKAERCDGCAGDVCVVSEEPHSPRELVCRAITSGVKEVHRVDYPCYNRNASQDGRGARVWIRKDDSESIAAYVAAKLES